MKAETRERRRNEIMDAATQVLAERGYRDATMLEVARRSSASKETLYAWFGDKRGLYEAVIRRNARSVQAVLERHLDSAAPTRTVLVEFGAALLELLLSDRAVAINRAAIAEARSDPDLARTLAKAGRDSTLPGFVSFLEARRQELDFENAEQAAGAFLGLLLGDSQVRRLLGVIPAPGKAQIDARAAAAAQSFLRLHAVE